MKILFSPGFGAGWSTWMDDKVTKDALTYQPIIDFIEGGGQFNCRYNFDDDGNYVLDNMHPLLKQFHADMIAKHGDNIILVAQGT